MQPMAAPCPLLGDGITDDTLLNIARFLPAARDLLCLRLTNSRFAAKVIAAAPRCIVEGVAAVAPEMLCIADEAARLWLVGCSEQERGWVPRYHLDRWLCLMQEVGLLRLPLLFGRAHVGFTLSEDGAVATRGGLAESYRLSLTCPSCEQTAPLSRTARVPVAATALNRLAQGLTGTERGCLI